MSLPDLTCPNCGNLVKQSKCSGCRRRKIRDYKCQNCGSLVKNPEYTQ